MSKVEEISRGRCSVCGQPATEDWQKYMAPRCAAHPHTATGRMVAGEEPVPTNPATGQPYFKVPAEGWGAEKLCVDEGCPHHGTEHVCVNLEAELRDILAEGVSGTYHCNRVWAAWGAGTMSQDDFEPVEESDTPAELARAVMQRVRPLLERTAPPLMTATEINALPRKAREYIHQLVANTDPAGMVRENMQLLDTNKGLQVMYRNRTDELDRAKQALELARNGLAWYRDAYPEADSGADDEMMETIAVALGEAHDLYTDADKDRPDVICDSNGQVVLGLCKRCGKAEAELHNEDGTPSPCSRA